MYLFILPLQTFSSLIIFTGKTASIAIDAIRYVYKDVSLCVGWLPILKLESLTVYIVHMSPIPMSTLTILGFLGVVNMLWLYLCLCGNGFTNSPTRTLPQSTYLFLFFFFAGFICR